MLNISVLTLYLFVAMITSGLASTQKPCKLSEKDPWSYDDRLANGPKNWGKTNLFCNGKQQSPIDLSNPIRLGTKGLQMKNYGKNITKATFENNGHSVVITPEDNVKRSIVIAGKQFSLVNIHFHWGDKKGHGALHTIDNKKYTMEIVLMHKSEEGVTALVSVLHFEASKNNKRYENIVKSLDKILYKGMKTEGKDPINLQSLVYQGCAFYRYTGSLPHPPCTEGVIWSICKKRQPIGRKQLDALRKLYSYDKKDSKEELKECKISNNNREIQPLNGRKMISSS